MDKIRDFDKEAFDTLEAANVDNDILLNFSREDLKDLFDGAGNFLLRRKIWNIIESARALDCEVANSFQTPPNKNKSSGLSVPTHSLSSQSPSSWCSSPLLPVTGMSESPQCVDLTGSVVKPEASPTFVIYSDSEIAHAAQTNSISDTLFNKLVRNTISNMRSACNNLKNPREPTTLETEEMAKALCLKFPCLERVCNADGHYGEIKPEERARLTEEQKSKLHVYVFSRLKKRRSNSIPTRKPQGKVPARSNKAKRTKLALPELGKDIKRSESSSGDMHSDNNSTSETEDVEDSDVAERYYRALDKEQRKAKPKSSVINHYLNLDFVARKKLIRDTRKENRPAKVFEMYPCFKDPNEVVEEVRRILCLPKEKTPDAFMNKCVKTLENNVENLIYFGIANGDLQPPRCSSVDGKLCHLLKGINLMVKSKSKTKQKVDTVHFIQDDEEPDKWQQKRQPFVPGLLVTKSNGAMVLLGKEIFLSFNDKEISRALVSFLATFYLLDMDYPTNRLASMSFLQQLIFKDNQIHPDCCAEVKKALERFECLTE